MAWCLQPRSKGLYCQPHSGNPQPCMKAQGKVGKNHRSQMKQPSVQGGTSCMVCTVGSRQGSLHLSPGMHSHEKPTCLGFPRDPWKQEGPVAGLRLSLSLECLSPQNRPAG